MQKISLYHRGTLCGLVTPAYVEKKKFLMEERFKC